MSHVREGELHAYLDGALDRLGADVAARVREHLAHCADCQSRVAQERDLQEHAAALLERALPNEIVPPPFEELRRRAAVGGGSDAPQNDPRPSSLIGPATFPAWKWAWAASLVLALGTGWMMGGGSLDFRSFQTRPSAGAVAAPQPFVDEAGRVDGDVVEQEAEPEQFRSNDERVAPAGPPETAAVDALEAEVAPAAPAQSEELRMDRNEETTRARDAAPQPARAMSGARTQAMESAAIRRVAPAEVAESVAVSPRREAVPLEDAVVTGSADEESGARDLASDGAPLMIGGGVTLAVLDAGNESRGVLQRLPEGDSVLLIWTGDEAVDARLAQLEDALGANAVPSDSPTAVGQAAPTARQKLSEREADDAGAPMLTLGRSEAWPTVVRIRRGAALLTVYGTRADAELRAVLQAAGLLPTP